MIDANGKSLNEYIGDLQRSANEAFSKHRIIKTSGDRWVMHGNHGSIYWVEILWLEGQKLLVHGDICAVIFAYAARSYTPRQLVSWMGRSGLDYVCEKATIGTGSEVTKKFVPDLAIEELRWLMNEAVKNDDRDVLCHREEIEEAIIRFAHGDEPPEAIIIELYNAGLDPELLADLGRAISPRVVYAHAAVKRLDDLLTQQKEEKEHERRKSMASP